MAPPNVSNELAKLPKRVDNLEEYVAVLHKAIRRLESRVGLRPKAKPTGSDNVRD